MNGYGNITNEKTIFGIMLDFGVPAHLKGYHFIRYAVVMTSQAL